MNINFLEPELHEGILVSVYYEILKLRVKKSFQTHFFYFLSFLKTYNNTTTNKQGDNNCIVVNA
jgi:hypothetical protein